MLCNCRLHVLEMNLQYFYAQHIHQILISSSIHTDVMTTIKTLVFIALLIQVGITSHEFKSIISYRSDLLYVGLTNPFVFLCNIIIPADSTYVCSDGDVQLVNGISAHNGIVLVCYQNQWSAICGDVTWTSDTSGAITACKQLGYGTGVPSEQYGYYGQSFLPSFLSNVHCDVRSNRLIDCYHDTAAYLFCYYVASVTCQGISV